MAVQVHMSYAGQLRCQLAHGPSNAQLSTDAPTDNHGRGESFSPTDLVGAALLSCAATTMAIRVPECEQALRELQGQVIKRMSSEGPRTIAELQVSFTLPASLSEDERRRLEETARQCPVALSLGGQMRATMTFSYVQA